MARAGLTVEDTVRLVGESPGRLEAVVHGLPDEQLGIRPAADEWSAVERLGHVRSCADVWGGSIATILAGEHPTIRAVNPRTWVERTSYRQLGFGESFSAFRKQRRALLAKLRGLGEDDWTRAATVIGAGRPLERSVLSYAGWLARHERGHVGQLVKIVESVRG